MGGREGAPLVLLTSSCGSKRASVGRTSSLTLLTPSSPLPAPWWEDRACLGWGLFFPSPFLT